MRVLVTGASGYLGGLLTGRISGTRGQDLRTLSQADTAGITHIAHAAAVTRFGVDRATARRVNVEGTRHVVEFARRCVQLERLVLLSTLYTAGTRTGHVPEEIGRPAGFANNYEWSKHEAEVLVAGSGLPASIARLATVVADDDSGRVTQYNVVHNTLKLVYYGLLSLIPGAPSTPVPLATARYTTAAVEALLSAEPGVYHVCPSRTATLGELLDITYQVFSEDPSFARRRILRPAFCDRESFDDLLTGARSMRAGPVHDALDSMAPFAAQLYLPKTFEHRLQFAEPDPGELVRAVARYLVTSRWGSR